MTDKQLKMTLEEADNIYDRALHVFGGSCTNEYDKCQQYFRSFRTRILTISNMVDILLDDENDAYMKDFYLHSINKYLDEKMRMITVLYNTKIDEICTGKYL